MNALTDAAAARLRAGRARGARARPRDRTTPYSKDAQIVAIRGARRYLADKITRVASPHRLLDPKAGAADRGAAQHPHPQDARRARDRPRRAACSAPTASRCRASTPRVRRPGFGGGGMHGYRALEGTFLGGCLFSGRAPAGRGAARRRALPRNNAGRGAQLARHRRPGSRLPPLAARHAPRSPARLGSARAPHRGERRARTGSSGACRSRRRQRPHLGDRAGAAGAGRQMQVERRAPTSSQLTVELRGGAGPGSSHEAGLRGTARTAIRTRCPDREGRRGARRGCRCRRAGPTP